MVHFAQIYYKSAFNCFLSKVIAAAAYSHHFNLIWVGLRWSLSGKDGGARGVGSVLFKN